jgi:hypothetical protein
MSREDPINSFYFVRECANLVLLSYSFIPESTWERIGREVALPSSKGIYPSTYPSLPRITTLIIDGGSLCLSKSHFGLPQALGTA